MRYFGTIIYALCVTVGTGLFYFQQSTPVKIRALPPGTIVRASPVDIRLKIVSEKDFRNDRRVLSLMASQKMSGVAAFALLNAHPCTIVMPDTFKIKVIADKGQAWFNDPDTGDTLAHEILHCLHGNWHPTWDKIPRKTGTPLPELAESK